MFKKSGNGERRAVVLIIFSSGKESIQVGSLREGGWNFVRIEMPGWLGPGEGVGIGNLWTNG